MNKENASKLWKIIQEADNYLRGQGSAHCVLCTYNKYKDFKEH